MKKIEIEIPDGKRAEWVNGVLTLVDEKQVDNRPITERVKTFEDACHALGDEHPFVLLYNVFMNEIASTAHSEHDGDLLAYLKLRVIVAALNEGWEPRFVEGEYRYHPWFYLYTKEEYDEMGEEKKRRCVLRSGSFAYAYNGFVFVSASSGASSSYSGNGSRLVFKSSALARYAGEQFTDEWADFLFKPRTSEELNKKAASKKTTINFQ